MKTIKNQTNKFFKKLLVVILSLAMVFTQNSYAFGEGLNELIVEAETQEAAAVEETTSDEGTTEETTPEAATEEAAAPEETTDEVVAEDTDAEATTEEATTEEATTEDAEEEEERVKADYSYEDDNIKVEATLSDPTAVPDDAQFVVTQVSEATEGYNYGVYMQKLNESASEDADEYTAENTLLYDVAFMVQKEDEEGNAIEGAWEEYQPEAGSVKLNFQFKASQLSDGLGAEEAANVEVKHLPLTDAVRGSVDSTQAATAISTSDVAAEDTNANVTVASDGAELTVNNLSVFSFKNEDGQKNTWRGINTFSISDILSNLGDTVDYAAYANKFINGTHLEGNIKVGVLDALASDAVLNQSANVIQRNAVDKITVTKTVNEGVAGTFNFATYASDAVEKGKELTKFTITIENGETSGYLELTSDNAADTIGALSSKNVVVYELDSNGNIMKEGDKVDGKYTVSYTDNEVTSSKSTTLYTNYIGSITNSNSTDGSVWLDQNFFDSETFGSHTYIESMDDAGWEGTNYTFTSNGKKVYIQNYNGRDSSASNISQQDGIAAEVSSKLSSLSSYSASLATALNGANSGSGSLSVVNLTSTTGKLSSDFDNANFKSVVNGEGISETLNEDGYVLVNIDVTGYSSYSLDQITIDGQNADGVNEELARHIIYNFVTHGGTMDGNGNWSNYSAYTGTVTFDNVAAGMVFAPAATVVQSGGLRGSVIANVFDRKGGAETHKDSIVTQRNHKVTVHNESTGEESDDTSTTLSATKFMDGRNFQEGDSFTFAVTPKDNAPAFSNSEVTITPTSGTEAVIDFGSATYTAEGIYVYTITENAVSKEGVTSDPVAITVTVKVEKVDGKLTVTSKEYKKGDNAAESATFTNTYDAKGSATITANKATTGGLSKSGYSFQVTDGEKVVATGTSDEDGNVTFSKIDYVLTDAGKTFEYTISEVAGTQSGVTYDKNTYKVSVKVTDNGDGTLNTEVTYKDGKAPTFTNTYSVEGETNLSATKIMDGRNFQVGDSYTFKVTAKDGAPEFSNSTVTINPTEGTSATVDFGTAKFTAAGTYTYVISETSKSGNGVTVDADPVTVTVTARDNGDGTLAIIKTYTKADKTVNAATFTNTYKVEGDTKAQFKATKSVAESSAWEDGDEFTIQLKDAKGEIVDTQVAKKDAATVTFKELVYTADSIAAAVKNDTATKSVVDGKPTYTFSYTISEALTQKQIDKGITAKVAAQNVTVVVTEDTATGKLSSKTYVESDGKMVETNEAVLVNEYKTNGTSATLVATKNLSGRALKAGEFSFQLLDENGKVLQTKTNAADGSITFDAIDYNEIGTHDYTIVEVVGELGGVSYDSAKQNVTVEVTKVGNKLVPTVTYDNAKGAVFTNTYAAKGSIELAATKATTNGLSKAGFKFEVKEGEKVVATGTSDEDGKIAFSKINYTLSDLGKHTYTVYEVAGSASGVTYSDAVYSVEVTVTDNGDGTLTAERSDTAGNLVFTNTYAASGEVVISGKKVLEGKTLKDGEFSFQLTGEGLDAPLTAEVKADGTFSFDTISYNYNQIGEHTYTITEVVPEGAVNGVLNGVTYSTDVYKVTVTVAEGASKNGQLEAKVTKVTKNDEEVKDLSVTFTNTYDANAELGLKGTKIYENATLEADKFGFTVYKKGGLLAADEAVANGTVDAEGNISFDKKLTYGLSDAGKSFDYVVKENIPEGAEELKDESGNTTGYLLDGITYDAKEYNFTVAVTDNGDGTLSTEVTGDNELTFDKETLTISGLNFTNSYFEAATELAFDKYFYGSNGSFEFTLQAADEQGNALAADAKELTYQTGLTEGKLTATVDTFDGDYKGSFTFDKISYSKPGTYYYTVSENTETEGSTVMDETVYLVKVTVSEDGTTKNEIKVLGEEKSEFAEMTSDNSAFYNNQMVSLSFKSFGMSGMVDTDAVAVIEPTATKKLVDANGNTVEMSGNEFDFELVDSAGNIIQTVGNTSDGKVLFDSMRFNAAGTYTYIIREVEGKSAAVVYDKTVYTLTVTVTKDGNAFKATMVYTDASNNEVAEPTFTNTYDGYDVRVQKVSRYGGEGLEDCIYALWMVGETGDVELGEATSDANGYITFKNVDLVKGAKYYFKEVKAPEGHTVDPYRTAYFTLSDDGTQLVLCEETSQDGWHAAGYGDNE